MTTEAEYPANALQAAAHIALGFAYWMDKGYISEREGDKLSERLDKAFDEYFDANTEEKMETALRYPKDGHEAASMITGGLSFATEKEIIDRAEALVICLWLDNKTRGYFEGDNNG